MAEKKTAARKRRRDYSKIQNRHHLIYGLNDNPRKQKDVEVDLRMSVHNIITKLRRYNELKPQEIWAIIVEALLKAPEDWRLWNESNRKKDRKEKK